MNRTPESVAAEFAELLANLPPSRDRGYEPPYDGPTPEPDYCRHDGARCACDEMADREFAARMGWAS